MKCTIYFPLNTTPWTTDNSPVLVLLGTESQIILIKAAKKETEKHIAKESKTNPKLFFNYINSKRIKTDNVGPLKNSEERMVVDDEEKANILNTFFSTVFTVENEMLATGSVPQDWRIANVVPIFKKGSKSEPGNYRPCHYPVPRVSVSLSCTPSVSVIILYPQCQCHYPVPRVSVSLSCTPSVSVIILYPECQRHYPVPPVSVSLSCTPSVSVIILYPECQCHYPVPPVSVSLSCTPSVSVIILYPQCQCHYPVPPVVSVIILYPECQCHYPVPRVSVSLSCTPSVSVIILYPECQCHYPVPPVSVSLSCTPSVRVIILYPQCQCHYPVPRVSVPLSCTPSVSVIILYPQCQCHYPVPPVDSWGAGPRGTIQQQLAPRGTALERTEGKDGSGGEILGMKVKGRGEEGTNQGRQAGKTEGRQEENEPEKTDQTGAEKDLNQTGPNE
ncbi:unnamed protein product, partial [Ranitomeya imitator]